MGWVYLHADTDWVNTVFRRNISIISLSNIQGKTAINSNQRILLKLLQGRDHQVTSAPD